MKKNYLVYGDDSSRIRNYLQKIKAEILSLEFGTVKTVYISKKEEVKSFCEDLSLFQSAFSDELIVLYINPKILKFIDENPDEFKECICRLAILKRIFFVVVFEKIEKDTVQRFLKSQFLTIVQHFALVNEFIKPKPWDVSAWKNYVLDEAKKLNLEFENDALNFFVHCCEGDNVDVETMLRSVQIYIYPEAKILLKELKELFSSELNMDTVCDSLLNKDYPILPFLKTIYDDSRSMIYLLAIIQNKLRRKIYIKSLLEQGFSASEVSKRTGINNYALEKEKSLLRSVQLPFLRMIVYTISSAEHMLKSGIINNESVLDVLFLRGFAARV